MFSCTGRNSEVRAEWTDIGIIILAITICMVADHWIIDLLDDKI